MNTVVQGGAAFKTTVSFVAGRSGKISILDCILTILSSRAKDGAWPRRTFRELAEQVSVLRRDHVAQHSIRSAVYAHDELFLRSDKPRGVTCELSTVGRRFVTGQQKRSAN